MPSSGKPSNLIQERSWEFSIADRQDYKTKISILESWSKAINRELNMTMVNGNKRLMKKVRRFYLAAHSICDWSLLNWRKTEWEMITRVFIRCRGLV